MFFFFAAFFVVVGLLVTTLMPVALRWRALDAAYRFAVPRGGPRADLARHSRQHLPSLAIKVQ